MNQRSEASSKVCDETGHESHSHVPVQSIPGTGRRLGIFVAVLAVGLAVGFFLRHRSNARAEMSLSQSTMKSADARPEVDVVRVAYASPSHVLTLPGETRAWYQSTIYARVSGYVDKWLVDIGDHVTKGQVLATIDTPDLDDQLIAARAKLNATQAEVTVAQANADFAKKTYDRWWESPKGVVSQQEREEKKADYDSGMAKLMAAQAQVRLDQADVERLQAMETFKNVTAPFDGTITARRIDIGDLVTAGSTSSTTSLFDIAQFNTIRVLVDVPQSAVPDVRDGLPATAVAREIPGRTFTGKVARTSRSIDPIAKTLHVEVDIDNKDQSLLPGMYVQTSFHTQDANRQVQIPASALSFRSNGPQVAVVSADGQVKFQPVTIGRDMGEYVEIASGLSAGERVGLNISNQIADGDRVAVNEVDDSKNQSDSAKTRTAVAVRGN